MYCTSCGERMEDGDLFCTSCGASHAERLDALTAEMGEATIAVDPAQGSGADAATPYSTTSQTEAQGAHGAAGQQSSYGTAGAPGAYGVPGTTGQAYTYGQQGFSSDAPSGGAGSSEYGVISSSPASRKAQGGLATDKKLIGAIVAVGVVAAIAVGVFALPAILGDGDDASDSSSSSAKSSSEKGDSDDKDSKSDEDSGKNGGFVFEDDEGESDASDSDASKGNASAGASDASADAAQDYVLPDSNSRYYSKDELYNMTLEELFYARNEIFARHGRGFNNATLKSYFGAKSWYTERYSPETFDSMTSPLNSYEKKNSELMLEVEKERNSPYLTK